MKTFKRLAVTLAVQAVLLTAAVVLGYVTVSALPVVVPMTVALACWMTR